MPKNVITDNQFSSNPVNESQSKILKNLSHRLTDDYFNRKNFPLRSEGAEGDNNLQDINAFIKKSSRRISGQQGESDSLPPVPPPDPEQFNGISGPQEERQMMLEQMKHLERENLKLKHQFELLQTDYQTEKRTLSGTIRDLKTELHRTAPLTENKFFTFSKDLRAVVSAVSSLSDPDLESSTNPPGDPEPILPTPLNLPPTTPPSSPTVPDDIPTNPKEVVKNDRQTEPDSTPSDSVIVKPPGKPKLSPKTKVMAASSTAVAIFAIGISLVLFGRKPPVDPALVNSYINADGTVQGASDTVGQAEAKDKTARREFKNNQVSYDETDWQYFRDEFLGFQVRYPANTTDLLHTGQTITFLRKEGYIFKMQLIPTKLPLTDYWQSIQKDSLKYLMEPVTLNGRQALHLTLDEPIDYPGNRYLVQVADNIADVWYATNSANFDPDDVKRAKYMVDSMMFL